jgi:2-oxoglutarate dehydrogenase E1 component
VVWETLNLSQLRGYRTGGSIHIIINNQIGFTTTPEEARSSPNATDVAKAVQAPIFHINGEDPDAAMQAAGIAYAYRQQFKKDVVLDVVCYRRHGHNEGDEPTYTQPLMYRKIKERPSVVSIYADRLVREGVTTENKIEEYRADVRRCLDGAYEDREDPEYRFDPEVPLAVTEEELLEYQPKGGSGTGMAALREVARALAVLPEGFALHPKLKKFFSRRAEKIEEESGVDWAFSEALAFGTLLYEGTPVRLSGQDSIRGTFSQRHLSVSDMETGETFQPLRNIHPEQANFEAIDSTLSEAAVLGFEFGYSAADPLALVLWEAQFGDFSNGAQVIIDNFLVSSEAKWRQPCDLVMLLPHGYEGQGPEHSSARLERFLSLCAEDNMRVAYPSTPAQYFHLLRQQMRDADRMPLVVLTPKSLLRHPGAVSKAGELAVGRFELVQDDPGALDGEVVSRVLMCSGKVYYDLLKGRDEHDGAAVAIVRLEQLFPYPEWHVSEVLRKYDRSMEICWVQEEPRNMGAWPYLSRRIAGSLPFHRDIQYIGRPDSASPAEGSRRAHRGSQSKIIRAAFDGV